MGRIDAVISDSIIEEFRVAVVRRLGGKKGDFSKALEDAMDLWTKQDIINNLKNHIQDNTILVRDRKEAIGSLIKQGKSAIPALTELLSSDNMLTLDRQLINKGIQELSS